LHSGNGWLMCRVFCKSIGIRFSDTALSSSYAIPVAQEKLADSARIVFVFFTILYQLKTPIHLAESSISRQSAGSSVRFSPSPANNGTSRLRSRISAFVNAAMSLVVSVLFNTKPTHRS
jgi:hypothetical protein